MKRMLAIVIALLLLYGTASAQGLSGLSGGGLPDIGGDASVAQNVVPDPKELLGYEGKVLQRNYQFSVGYTCTAYTYTIPKDTATFLDRYTAQATANKLTVAETTMEGYSTWTFTASDGKYAMLLPDYQGVMLLLVQNGMSFGKASIVEKEQMVMDYNGRTITLKQNTVLLGDTTYNDDAWCFLLGAEKTAPFRNISFDLPIDFQAGSSYEITKGKYINGVNFWIENKDYDYINYVDDYKASYHFKSRDDYYRVTITEVFSDDSFKGTIEARMDDGNIIIDNCMFYLRR